MLNEPLSVVAERAPGDVHSNTASIRTGINALVIGAIVFLLQKVTGNEFDAGNPAVVLVGAAILAFGSRASYVITSKWPSVAWVLFGIGAAPKY